MNSGVHRSEGKWLDDRLPFFQAVRELREPTGSLTTVMFRVVALSALACIALVLGGCGAGAREAAPTVQGMARESAIYAAVIRQLATKDHTFGGADPGFKVVYVLDGVIEQAADPSKTANAHDPQEPFADDLKDEVRSLSRLANLPPVKFVSERDSVLIGTDSGSSPGRVKNGGVLISLGPIERTRDGVHVGTSLWISGLAGRWSTYVLQQAGGTWEITGTSGPVAIS
jgi:hypothetical protein